MKLLKTIKDSDLFLRKYDPDAEKERRTARAVVFDNENNVAILRVSKLKYHKLPGGGVEEGESSMETLRREVLEEIGCEITVTGELGRIIEYRGDFKLKQESFCYIAKLKGEKGTPDFTDEEIRDGFQVMWMSLHEAIEKIKADKPLSYEGKFIQNRDLCLLEEAELYKK